MSYVYTEKEVADLKGCVAFLLDQIGLIDPDFDRAQSCAAVLLAAIEERF